MRFRSPFRLKHDNPKVLAYLGQIDPDMAECLRQAFLEIERGDRDVFPFLWPGSYRAEACDHTILLSANETRGVGTVTSVFSHSGELL
jgi:hypothetical protein